MRGAIEGRFWLVATRRAGYIASMNTTALPGTYDNPVSLDREICRAARLSRDPRFDGEFFLGVKTTGIYCRPVCPARPPAEKNVSYFASAAQAALAGFRPCLRCRPESAPNSPAWQGTSATVARALQLIEEGALSNGSLPQLAGRLGVGERYLRKLFRRELGISPSALALNQRLLFAKKLLAETTMPITDVAFAAGFGSVRRFNSAVQTHLHLAPSQLRRLHGQDQKSAPIRLSLQYRPPYDWESVADFFARHAVAGVESASSEGYQRHIRIHGATGWISVRPLPGKNALQLELHIDNQRLLMPVVARVRRMFDLDANPAAIAQTLGSGPLQPLLQNSPGIRAPGYWSLFEAALRAVIGQQISTAAARSILARLASACGGQFPCAQQLAALDDSHFPMPGKRRETVRALCELQLQSQDDLNVSDIAALRGIGPWSTAMIAMRGSGHPDSFPEKDLGILHAWADLQHSADINDYMGQWRPWRSYAANLLWRSLPA